MAIVNAPNGEEMDGYTEGRNAFFILVGVEALGFEIGLNPRLRIRASARFGHYIFGQ